MRLTGSRRAVRHLSARALLAVVAAGAMALGMLVLASGGGALSTGTAIAQVTTYPPTPPTTPPGGGPAPGPVQSPTETETAEPQNPEVTITILTDGSVITINTRGNNWTPDTEVCIARRGSELGEQCHNVGPGEVGGTVPSSFGTTTKAGPDGSFEAQFTVPADAEAGTDSLQVIGYADGKKVTVSRPLTVRHTNGRVTAVELDGATTTLAAFAPALRVWHVLLAAAFALAGLLVWRGLRSRARQAA